MKTTGIIQIITNENAYVKTPSFEQLVMIPLTESRRGRFQVGDIVMVYVDTDSYDREVALNSTEHYMPLPVAVAVGYQRTLGGVEFTSEVV